MQTSNLQIAEKKRFIRTILIGLITLGFLSCKKEPVFKSQLPKTTPAIQIQKDSNFVSFDLAVTAAKQVGNSHLVNGIMTKQAINGSVISATKEILDTLAMPDNINPSCYILNYVGGGYVIIATDKRVKPILAFSNDGYFPHSGNLPGGLFNWLAVNHKNMQLVRNNAALKAPPGIAKLWAELSVTNSTKGNLVIDKAAPPPPPCQPAWTSYTVGPLLKTDWAQGYPYNQLCPVGNYYYSGHNPAGCVATAMAQVMYYWKTPARYNWSAMPLTSPPYIPYADGSPGNIAVAQLMLDIGTSVKMQYNDNGSNPKSFGFVQLGPITCSDALKDSFGYGSSTEGSYDYLKVMSNLNTGEPVLLSASTDDHSVLGVHWFSNGHEWVCDGYQEVNDTWCPSQGVPGGSIGYLYLHMNWGWDEAGVTATNSPNGLYSFDNWSVLNGTTQVYQYNQSMSYNIHP